MRVVPLRLRPGDDLLPVLEAWMGRQTCTTLNGELEIISLAGTLSADGSHLHIALAGNTGAVIGGHLCAGSLVRTTAELVVGLLPEWQFRRALDPATGYAELLIHPAPDSPDHGKTH